MHTYISTFRRKRLVPGLAYCYACDVAYPGNWPEHINTPRHKHSYKMLHALGEVKEGIDYDKPYSCTEPGRCEMNLYLVPDWLIPVT